MVKLSFIVPVYNVEQYLRKCVDSLLAQDYEGYEIILIDDGSTDGSSSICDDYVRRVESGKWKVESIRVIHQKNGGLSAARNAGINAAKGEYVCFVDSDDYWEPNVLSGLMEQVEDERLDVLRFDYQNVRLKVESGKWKVESEYEVFEPNKSPRYVDKGTEVVDGETYLNTRMGYACYAVMFIIRQSLIAKSEELRGKSDGCLFKEGIHFEDVEWLPRMMLRAKRVNSTTMTVYNYLVRQGSITKTQGDKSKIRKNVEDQMTVMQRYSELIEQHPDCRWLRNMQSSMAAGVLTSIARSLYEERKAYIERLKEIKVYPLSITNQGKTYARRARLINAFGPYVYCVIMHIMNKK